MRNHSKLRSLSFLAIGLLLLSMIVTPAAMANENPLLPTPPTVVQTGPSDQAVDVATDGIIWIQYDRTVVQGPGASGMLLLGPGDESINLNANVHDDNLLVMSPMILQPDSDYTVSLPEGAVIELLGGESSLAFSFGFRTGAATVPGAPGITIRAPHPNTATNVPVLMADIEGAGIVTVEWLLHSALDDRYWSSAAGEWTEDQTWNVAFTSGEEPLLTVELTLPYSGAGPYGATLRATNDQEISSTASVLFQLDLVAPTFVSQAPTSLDDLPVDSSITFLFDEPILAADLSKVVLTDSSGMDYSALYGLSPVVEGSAGQLVITHQRFDSEVTYNLTVGAGAITDYAGNPNASIERTFTTASPPPPPPPIVLQDASSLAQWLETAQVGEARVMVDPGVDQAYAEMEPSGVIVIAIKPAFPYPEEEPMGNEFMVTFSDLPHDEWTGEEGTHLVLFDAGDVVWLHWGVPILGDILPYPEGDGFNDFEAIAVPRDGVFTDLTVVNTLYYRVTKEWGDQASYLGSAVIEPRSIPVQDLFLMPHEIYAGYVGTISLMAAPFIVPPASDLQIQVHTPAGLPVANAIVPDSQTIATSPDNGPTHVTFLLAEGLPAGVYTLVFHSSTGTESTTLTVIGNGGGPGPVAPIVVSVNGAPAADLTAHIITTTDFMHVTLERNGLPELGGPESPYSADTIIKVEISTEMAVADQPMVLLGHGQIQNWTWSHDGTNGLLTVELKALSQVQEHPVTGRTTLEAAAAFLVIPARPGIAPELQGAHFSVNATTIGYPFLDEYDLLSLIVGGPNTQPGDPVGQFSAYLPAALVALWDEAVWIRVPGQEVNPVLSPVGDGLNVTFTMHFSDWTVLFGPGLVAAGNNLQAILKDAAGALVTDASVVIFPVGSLYDWDAAIWASTDVTGRLEITLPEGHYVLTGWSGGPAGWQETYLRFTVADEFRPDLNPAELIAPPPNVTGQVSDIKGTALGGLWIGIQPLADPYGSTTWWVMTDSAGNFGAYLPDGSYQITAISGSDLWEELSIGFTLAGGLLTEGPLLLQLRGENVTGSIQAGATPVAWASVLFCPSLSTGACTWGTTDANGTFALYLPAGDYSVAEVWADGKLFAYAPADYTLSVDTSGAATPSHVAILLPVPNVIGEVRDAGGEPLAGAWVTIEGAELTHYAVSEAGGQFQISLPDGDYTITGLSTDTTWTEVKLPFTVAGGEQSVPLIVQPPALNVTGRVELEGNVLPFTTLYFAPIWRGQTDERMMQMVTADAAGQFALHLEPGSWELYGFSRPDGLWQSMEMLLEVGASPVLLIVSQNVQGMVVDARGRPLSDAVVGIRPPGAQESDWQFVRWAWAEADGSFALYLAPGTYEVFQVWSQRSAYELALPFTVEADGSLTIPGGGTSLLVSPPEPNLTGIVLGRNGEPRPYAQVGLTPLASSSPSSLRIAEADKFGQFQLSLPAGTDWAVVYVSTPAAYEEISLSFTVPAEGSLNLVVRPPQPNLTGSVTNRSGQPLPHALVSFRAEGVGSEAGDVWATADAQGRFDLMLAPGSYRVIGVSTGHTWIDLDLPFTIAVDQTLDLDVTEPVPNVIGTTGTGGDWVAMQPVGATGWAERVWTRTSGTGQFEAYLTPGEWVAVSISGANRYREFTAPFTVPASGQVDLGLLPPTANVTGVLRQSSGAAVAHVWMTIVQTGSGHSIVHHVETNGLGQFAIFLSDGQWQVISIASADGFVDVTLPFTVTGSALLELEIPAQAVTGTITIGAKAAARVWVAIRPLIASQSDPTVLVLDPDLTRTRWVQTDAAGGFSLGLADGEWALTDISTASTWISLEQPLTFDVVMGQNTAPIQIDLP